VVDRVYQSDIPEKRRALEKLKAEFLRLDSKSDWINLRVEPLLLHVKQLEQRLKSHGTKRLRKGVRLYHSDLVYLRENVNGLKAILASERRALERRVAPVQRRAK
jgi:hypothetical protein